MEQLNALCIRSSTSDPLLPLLPPSGQEGNKKERAQQTYSRIKALATSINQWRQRFRTQSALLGSAVYRLIQLLFARWRCRQQPYCRRSIAANRQYARRPCTWMNDRRPLANAWMNEWQNINTLRHIYLRHQLCRQSELVLFNLIAQ